jgi:3-dehydroquinate dehydratase II
MVLMADKRILLLNGPNLNLLGTRQPEIYGKENLADHVQTVREAALLGGYEVEHLQSNHEGDLIDAIQHARGRTAAIIFNPGAFTHYAHALADALAAYDGVVIEVHLSNPAAREAWRHTSVIAPVATGTISGFGGTGYRLAVEAALSLLEDSKE